jgi:hypothetical protein
MPHTTRRHPGRWRVPQRVPAACPPQALLARKKGGKAAEKGKGKFTEKEVAMANVD